MGKLSKEETARFSGADWMLRYAEEHGLDEARKELERRGVRQIPLKMKDEDVLNLYQNERKNITACILTLAVSTLRDEYGFSTERVRRFIERFNLKAACIAEDYVSFEDLQESIHQETGVYITLPGDYVV
jgi:predicted transcriptional regulator